MSELLDRLVALARPVWEGQPVTDEIVEEAADLAAQLSEDERQLASLVLSGLYAEQEPEIADSEIDADMDDPTRKSTDVVVIPIDDELATALGMPAEGYLVARNGHG